MPLTPLTKYFIKATIGWKDYSVINKEIAEQIQAEDSEDEFHIEPIPTGLYQLWTAKEWKRKDELERMMDENSKKAVNEQIDKYNHAMTYLTTEGNLSEEDARELISMPQIRQKFGLL